MAFWSRRQRPPFPTDHDAEALERVAEAAISAGLDRLDAVDPQPAVPAAAPEIGVQRLRVVPRREDERIVPWRERLRDGPDRGLETPAGGTHLARDG